MSWDWQDQVNDYPTQTADIGGSTHAWREAGAGPALVLLHGIGSGSASWVYQLTAFSRSHRVLALETPGYGQSSPIGVDWPKAADYAARLGAFLDHMLVKKCVLIGHSLGAMIAASFASLWPERLNALCLADPAAGHARLDDDDRQERLTKRLSAFERLGVNAHAKERAPRLLSNNPTPNSIALVEWNMRRLNLNGYRTAARLLSGGDLMIDAPRIATPTCVVWGAEDRITPPAGCAEIASRIPGCRKTAEIDRAGHASYLERPEPFNGVVGDLLAEVGP